MEEFFRTVFDPAFLVPFLDLLSSAIVALMGMVMAAQAHQQIKNMPLPSRSANKTRLLAISKAVLARAGKSAAKRRVAAQLAAGWLILSSLWKLWNLP